MDTDRVRAGAGPASEGPASEVAAQIRQLERRQELKTTQENARRQLKEAKKTREGTARKGWFKRRLEGRRQEKQAHQVIERTGEKLKDLPPERTLKKQVGKGIQALSEKERRGLEASLSPVQMKLAHAASQEVERAARRTMDRDRGHGMSL